MNLPRLLLRAWIAATIGLLGAAHPAAAQTLWFSPEATHALPETSNQTLTGLALHYIRSRRHGPVGPITPQPGPGVVR